jgi:hypothetical protein
VGTRVSVSTRTIPAPQRSLAVRVRPGAVVYARIEIESFVGVDPISGPLLLIRPIQGELENAYFRHERIDPFHSNAFGSQAIFPEWIIDAIQPAPIITPWDADIELLALDDDVAWEMSIGHVERTECGLGNAGTLGGDDMGRGQIVPRDRKKYTLTQARGDGRLLGGPPKPGHDERLEPPVSDGRDRLSDLGPGRRRRHRVVVRPRRRADARRARRSGQLLSIGNATAFTFRGVVGERYSVEWEIDIV